MSDVRAEVTNLIDEHRRSLDDLHQKLAGMGGVDKERLATAVNKLKSAHVQFADDAQEFVVH